HQQTHRNNDHCINDLKRRFTNIKDFWKIQTDPDQRHNHDGSQRTGHTDKITFVDYANLYIETCQTERSTRGINKTGCQTNTAQITQAPAIHQNSGSHTKSQHVRKRIELFAEWTLCTNGTCHTSIQPI